MPATSPGAKAQARPANRPSNRATACQARAGGSVGEREQPLSFWPVLRNIGGDRHALVVGFGDGLKCGGHPPRLPSALKARRLQSRGVDLAANPGADDACATLACRLDTSEGRREVDRPRKVEHQLAVVRLPGPPQTVVLPDFATARDRNRRVPRGLVDLAVINRHIHSATTVPRQ
jgi:hypothetical protein